MIFAVILAVSVVQYRFTFQQGNKPIAFSHGQSVCRLCDLGANVVLGRLTCKVAASIGIISPDWNVSMIDIHRRKLLCVYCLGHAILKGNDRADRLVYKATLTSGLLLGRSEVFRSLRHYLPAESQGHHTTDRLEERGMETGSAR